MELRRQIMVWSAIWTLGCSFSVSCQIPGLTPEKAWDLDGYIKYMVTASYPDGETDALDHIIHQRFNYEYRFSPQLRMNAGIRNRLIWGDSAEDSEPSYADQIGQDGGYMDLSTNWEEGDGSVSNSQFDRLFLNWEQNDWQLRGGRFRINWGMTTIWNPNDIFNAYSLYEVDYAERPGTDAVMLSRKLGFASGLDVVYSPDDESGLTSYAARYMINNSGWDIQFIGGKSGLDSVLGVGVAGDIQGAGFRGELSYFEPTRSSWKGAETENCTISSIEMDYSFAGTGNRMIRAAILGISDPVDTSDPVNTNSAAAFLNETSSVRTLSFTELTGFAEVSFDTSPLNRISVSGIVYQDKSVYFSITNQYSLGNNWQLTGIIQRFDGKNGSVFGLATATFVYVQVGWNFQVR